MPSLAFRLAPGGALRGIEYIVRNPTRADRTPGSFKINTRTGRWADFAVGARGGSIIGLVAYLYGVGPVEAARELAKMLGISSGDEPWRARPARPTVRNERPQVLPSIDENSIRQALETFAEAVPLPDTPGEVYLIDRIRQRIDWPADLRFHPVCPGKFGPQQKLERHPALIALLRNIHTNEPRAIHRTFLKSDGTDRLRDEWGNGDEGKKALGPMRGCAFKLSPDECVTHELCVAEGVETGLSLFAREIAPVWVTCGTSGMKQFPVLPGIKCLTIFADHDTNSAGSNAARECAVRWMDAGREVVLWTPGADDADWNDVLRGAV
jgi:hypothetical protein